MSECVRRGGQESTVEHKNQQVWMVILARGGGEGRGSGKQGGGRSSFPLL